MERMFPSLDPTNIYIYIGIGNRARSRQINPLNLLGLLGPSPELSLG